MADIKDRLSKGLSEIRTVMLGAQILFGFQYQAVFQPGFANLARWAMILELAAFSAMLSVIIMVVTPTPFHRICERGDATVRHSRLISVVMASALAVFAAALGANVAVSTSVILTPLLAASAGAAATSLSLFLWFGIEIMKKRTHRDHKSEKDARLPLKEKISQLLTEARLVLPGVQALLGFQFAAFLTEAFRKLAPATQAVHTASLILLATAMVLLMTPAPFHRIAEGGEDTPRIESVAQNVILMALIPMALGLGGDFYVALMIVTDSVTLAAAGATATVCCAAALWFAFPLGVASRDRSRLGGAR